MKKILLLAFALVAFSSFKAPITHVEKVKEYVLVCDSKNAKVYHKDYKYTSEYCTGLKNCKHQIIRILKSDASATKRACKHCWR